MGNDNLLMLKELTSEVVKFTLDNQNSFFVNVLKTPSHDKSIHMIALSGGVVIVKIHFDYYGEYRTREIDIDKFIDWINSFKNEGNE